MPETEVDRRGHRLLLLSHGVLAGTRSGRIAQSVVDWADRHQVGLYQLPLPAHVLRPRTPGGRLSRPRVEEQREEDTELETVFSQLVDYLDAGYRVIGLTVREDEVSTRVGQAWLDRVLEKARDTAALELEVWRIPKGADGFDPDVPRSGTP